MLPYWFSSLVPSCLAAVLVGVEQLKNMTTGPPTNPIHSQLKSTSTDDRLSPTMSWKTKISTKLDKSLLSRNISGLWEKGREELNAHDLYQRFLQLRIPLANVGQASVL